MAPYTLDADLAITPAQLHARPDLTSSLEGAGFRLTKDIGIWAKEVDVEGLAGHATVDLLVPALLGARIGPS